MAGRSLVLLGLLVAGAFATCSAPSGISMLFETWVPVTPYVGEASYMVVNGTNNQATSFTWTHCTIELYQGSYSYGTKDYIPCWTDEVKPGASFRFQSDVVWVPADAPLGAYTWELTTYDQFGNEGGCWSGSLDVEEDPNPNNNVCVAPTDISLSSETWVPATPYSGEASFIVVSGTNNQATSFTWTHCAMTLTLGSYSYGSDDHLSCWTDEVKPGAPFRFQTGAIWVPADAPLGTYTWQLTTYDQFGNAAGCWSGSVTVEKDPNSALSDFYCANDGTLTLDTNTWVPATPNQGQASYVVVSGQNKRNTPVTVRYAKVTLFQVNGYASYSTPGAIDAYSGPVAAGGSINFQTGSIWIPQNLPVSNYITHFTALDLNMNILGCFTGQVSIQTPPSAGKKTCSPGIFTAHTETWVPANPQRGGASYVVVAGVNTAQYTANSFNCTVTLTQGPYSYGSNGRISCWTGPVAAGADFRVQTDAVNVPVNAPLGTYITEIQAYALNGDFVGCYTGTAFVVNPPTVQDS